VTIYLTSGVKLSGRVRGFDKYCVIFETNHQEQLIFKHAISTVVTARHGHGPRPHSAPAAASSGEQQQGEHATPGQPPVASES